MQELGDRPGKRLLVVANRLPVSVAVRDDGQIDMTMAGGGLVAGLQTLSKSIEFQWFGWPGTDIHKNDQGDVARELDKQYNSVPIFLSKEAVENYYNGFSNSVLWPLLHSLHFRVQFSHTWARAYREVNKYFADTIIPYVQDGDRIWVHDYHLMLLPRLLRNRLQDRKNVRIGFFLHTPFPESDAFDIMPMREEICDGLLSCDLAGFHIREYVDNFLDCASGVLSGVKRSPSDLHYLDRKLIAHEFPLGIDPAEYKKSIACDATQTELGRLQDVFRGKKVILGVDRLDYTKGLPQKLHAYDRMLSENPEWIGKVQMVQLCVPTRSTVEEYKILRHEVESLVGRINGTHGTLTWTPVQYLHRTLDPDVLHALYAIADICIVSAIRDGLNLVCFEYVASQLSRHGVLMLSQYTGAARLFDTAVEFNPWDTPKFANAIAQALDMPQEERDQRLEGAQKIVNKWTSERWGLNFVKCLQSSEFDKDNYTSTHKPQT